MNAELRKVVNYNKCRHYVDKDGNKKDAPSSNYYVRVNGKDICIKPCFVNDYEKLDLLSDLVIVGNKDNKKFVD